MEKSSTNTFWRYALTDWSTSVLIFSNIITIIFAIIENWDISIIMFIYWCQSVIIGIFTVIKIVNLKNISTAGFAPGLVNHSDIKATKRLAIIIFVLYYGMFHVAYLFFLGLNHFFLQGSNIIISNFFIILSILIFFANHLFSFYYNKEKDANKKQHIGKVIMFPFIRIIPMHLTIIFGLGFMWFGMPQITLVIFLLLKTVADVMMHLVEHKPKALEKMLDATFDTILKGSGF
jgi:hypothetical protein